MSHDNIEDHDLYIQLNRMLEAAGEEPMTPAEFVTNLLSIFDGVIEVSSNEIPEEFQNLMEACAANPLLSHSLMECYPSPASIKG